MEHVSVYSQDNALLAVLDNAGDIGYDLKLNDLWTGSFTLPASDPKNAVCEAHNFVRLPDGPRKTGLYRILSMPSGEVTTIGGAKAYNVEHVIATLLDDVLFGYHEVGGTGVTTRQVMQYILDRQTVRRWQLGQVDFTDYFQYHFENISLLSALLSLGEVLTDEYVWDFDTDTTPWTVNLLRAGSAPDCGIYYGRNLVEITKTMEASALVTRLYPLGYGEGVNQLTIRDVNGGIPYIDADTVATWGVKCSVWTDTRIEDPATLKARARQVLEGYKNPYITYTAKAVDWYRHSGFSWDNFMPGKLVWVHDREHGITFQARIVGVVKSSVNGDPGDIEITIANAPRDAASSLNTLADRVGIGELYSQGATNLFAIPFADNADPTHPAKMRVYVPSGLVRINKMLLSWQVAPFRAYETSAASGGSTTQTSGGGGGGSETTSISDTVVYTTEDGGSTQVTVPQVVIGSGSTGGALDEDSGTSMTRTGGPCDAALTEYTAANFNTGSGGSHSHTVNSHNHGMSHHHNISGHKHSVDSHSHGLNSHTHTLGSHKHEVGSHTHSIGSHWHNVDSHSHGMYHYHHTTAHDHSITAGASKTGGANPDTNSPLNSSGRYMGSTDSASSSTGTASGNTGDASSGYTAAASGNTGSASGSTETASPNTSEVSLKTAGCLDNSDTLLTKTEDASPGTDSQGSHSHSAPLHYHRMKHFHMIAAYTIPAQTIDIPAHGHNVSIPGHSHSVTIPGHTHSVTIPDHTHDITYGIYEGSTAQNVTIMVDGSPVPAAEITGHEIDVSAYLRKDSNGKITRNSWHEIQIVPDQLSRIEANLFAQCFIQSVGGGDY